jgi:hypothetical protein
LNSKINKSITGYENSDEIKDEESPNKKLKAYMVKRPVEFDERGIPIDDMIATKRMQQRLARKTNSNVTAIKIEKEVSNTN